MGYANLLLSLFSFSNLATANPAQQDFSITCYSETMDSCHLKPLSTLDLRVMNDHSYKLEIVDNTNCGHPIIGFIDGKQSSAQIKNNETVYTLIPSGVILTQEHSGPPTVKKDNLLRILNVAGDHTSALFSQEGTQDLKMVCPHTP